MGFLFANFIITPEEGRSSRLRQWLDARLWKSLDLGPSETRLNPVKPTPGLTTVSLFCLRPSIASVVDNRWRARSVGDSSALEKRHRGSTFTRLSEEAQQGKRGPLYHQSGPVFPQANWLRFKTSDPSNVVRPSCVDSE